MKIYHCGEPGLEPFERVERIRGADCVIAPINDAAALEYAELLVAGRHGVPTVACFSGHGLQELHVLAFQGVWLGLYGPSLTLQMAEWFAEQFLHHDPQRVGGRIGVDNWYAELAKCQSPAELRLGLHLAANLPPWAVAQHVVTCGEMTYRLDFAVLGTGDCPGIAVEVDGHDFHERTKEQARRDRSRDRALVEAG